MDSKQWLIVQLYDERYDFNLNIRTFKGTLEELAESDCLDVAEFKPYNRGWYEYQNTNRMPVDSYLAEYLQLNNIDRLEKVSFDTLLCIPVDEINWDDFHLYHPVVTRNLKFGFLDMKQ